MSLVRQDNASHFMRNVPSTSRGPSIRTPHTVYITGSVGYASPRLQEEVGQLLAAKIDPPVKARLSALLRTTGFLKAIRLRSICVQRHLCFDPLPPIRYRTRIERTGCCLYLEFAMNARAVKKSRLPVLRDDFYCTVLDVLTDYARRRKLKCTQTLERIQLSAARPKRTVFPGVVDGPVEHEVASKSTEFVLRVPLSGWHENQLPLRRQIDALDRGLDDRLDADLVEELTRETPGPGDSSAPVAEFFIVTPEPEVLEPAIRALVKKFPIAKNATMIRRRAGSEGRGKKVII